MQPLKIAIYGDYWDCQIYMGKLYLWKMDGSLVVYNWNDLIDSMIQRPEDNLPLLCGFKESNYLYNSQLMPIAKDPRVKKIMIKSFEQQSRKKRALEEIKINNFLLKKQDNPFVELPTDTEIYSKNVYAITQEGLWLSDIKKTNNPVRSRPAKIWDCPLLSLKANRHGQIALSAGSEGLFEYSVYNGHSYFGLKEREKNIVQISEKHSLFSNYAFLSIYNSSNIADSFIAIFGWEKYWDGKDKYRRKYEKTIDEKEIFIKKSTGKLSWGNQDKIYRAFNGVFEIVTFKNNPREDLDEKYFANLREISISPWKGKVISGGVACFGTIIECENALIVALSDGQNYSINGPITRWRVYPRSKFYENHLHVILDDRIEIYSFVQDYFINQKEKSFGINYETLGKKSNRFG